jgi:formylglycine-generating enzyme required for sulfatase activity
VAGTCVANPPSCADGGQSNCGYSPTGGAGTDNCCATLEVVGNNGGADAGTFYRVYANDGGGATGESAPAVVSTFLLDKYDVTIGRFRQFVDAVEAPDGGSIWTPPPGSGKHVHLNGGQGLASSASGYEPGWIAADSANMAPATSNLQSCTDFWDYAPYATSGPAWPMACVNWYEAYAFCIWDGGFLPSTAEWQYAAAGGDQLREYPWGSAALSSYTYAVYSQDYGYPPTGGDGETSQWAPVGTSYSGVGRWGQFELVGNVFQWLLDDPSTPPVPCTDCASIDSANAAFAGGAWDSPQSTLHAWAYNPSQAKTLRGETGFRCARSP